MPNLFERNIATLADRLILLAPAKTPGHEFMGSVEAHSVRYEHLVHALQKLRGSVYLDDGAVQLEQLLPDGRHQVPGDEDCWHLIMLNRQGGLSACVWYHEYENTISADQLRLRECPLAQCSSSRDTFWNAVGSQLARARSDGLRMAEVGGWAVAKESRHTLEGLLLALAGYSLGRIRGGCLALTTATVRHCSSSILRRLGGIPLEGQGRAVPGYYDPRYGCDMEILQFDSRRPNSRYAATIEMLTEKLTNVLACRLPEFGAARSVDQPQMAMA